MMLATVEQVYEDKKEWVLMRGCCGRLFCLPPKLDSSYVRPPRGGSTGITTTTMVAVVVVVSKKMKMFGWKQWDWCQLMPTLSPELLR
jgi:hypothetical protein